MALQDHLKLACLVDGVFQIELSQIEINGESGAQAVETLQGLAGKTEGSGRTEITATWAVPIGGMEFDVHSAQAVGSYHTVQIPLGDKSYIGTGWFQNSSVGQSVNANTEARATWIGEKKKLE